MYNNCSGGPHPRSPAVETTRDSEALQKRFLNEGNGEQACQNDNAVPACMAAATNNPNDIRGSEEGLYAVGSRAQAVHHPRHTHTCAYTRPALPTTTTLLVRGSVIRWRVASSPGHRGMSNPCPDCSLGNYWQNTRTIACWALIMCTRHRQPRGN